MGIIAQSIAWWCFVPAHFTPEAFVRAVAEAGYAAIDLVPVEYLPLVKAHGLATSGLIGHASIANGLNRRDQHDRIARELRDSGASRIVVGCPYNEDGSRGALATRAAQFAAELGRRHGLPVHLVDERYSSLEATAALRTMRADGTRRSRVGKPDIDSAAAAVILERWLAGEGQPGTTTTR